MLPLIEGKRGQLAEACQRYGVVRLEVFGSAARGTDFDPETSDVDFISEFGFIDKSDPFGQLVDFIAELREILGRPVDLIESKTVKNPYLLKSINESRELVYAA